jgi:anaerobic selenocysteine-containing dehydrogenase
LLEFKSAEPTRDHFVEARLARPPSTIPSASTPLSYRYLSSFPDRRKTAAAFQSLDLLVAIDPWPTPTVRQAHYVLPPLMQYERADLPMNLTGYACWPGGWLQYTPPIVRPPEDAELVEDWYVFWALARRLGKTLACNGVPLDMLTRPSTDDLIALLLKDAPVSLDELKRHPSGIDVDIGGQRVLPARAEAVNHRFDPMPADVEAELTRYLADGSTPGRHHRDGRDYTHLLATRRMRDLFNSNGRHLRTIRERTPYNPAYLHPDDLAALGLVVGDRIELVSAAGRAIAIVGEDSHVKPGVVSMAHGWGGLSDIMDDPGTTGTAVNALIDTDRHVEAINAMPHMSAVPVNIIRLGAP